jgi:hypothetical protein
MMEDWERKIGNGRLRTERVDLERNSWKGVSYFILSLSSILFSPSSAFRPPSFKAFPLIQLPRKF